MKSFHQLTARGQARRLGTLARGALQAWDRLDGRLRLVANGVNTIFRLDSSRGTFAVRVHRPGGDPWRAHAYEWMQALAEHDLLVPNVIRTRDGQLSLTISPDNLRDSSTTATPWYSTMETASFAGGYSYDRFSHYECCNADTGSCYQPGLNATATPIRGDYVLTNQDDPPPASSPKYYLEIAKRRAWIDYAAQQPGQWVETEDELCWVADDAEVGRICTVLTGPKRPFTPDPFAEMNLLPEPLEVDPTDPAEAAEDALETLTVTFELSGEGGVLDQLFGSIKTLKRKLKKLAKKSKTYPAPTEPPVGTVRTETWTAAGEPSDVALIEDLIIDVEHTHACAGQAMVVHALASPKGANASIRIDGVPGTSVASTPMRKGRFTVAALATSADGQLSQVIRRTVRVKGCTQKALTVRAARLPHQDDAFAFQATLGKPTEKPVTYTWYFGDGTTQTTQLPYAEHSYALRAQGAAATSYLVTVEASFGKKTRTGYANAPLLNAAWNLRHDTGHFELPVRNDRRPIWGAGSLGAEFAVRHFDVDADPAVFESAQLTAVPCNPKREALNWEWALAELTEMAPIAAGAQRLISLNLPIPTELNYRICRWDVELVGQVGNAPASARAVYETGLREGVGEPAFRADARAALQSYIDAAQAQ